MHPHLHQREQLLMGNRFQITVVAENDEFATDCIDKAIKEIKRIEEILSTYQATSETNLINQFAGIQPVKVSSEVFQLVKRSIKISKLTQGAFDITYGSIDKRLWNFDCNMTELPDPETAKEMTRLINYRNIILNEIDSTVFLKEKGMRIGFGGIGKGYAAEMAKKVLIQLGVQSGIVNASGDLTVWGTQPNGEPWTVGIAHPDLTEKAFAMMELKDSAVATSGNYEKFVMINGEKYSHTIDPKTGLPVRGIKSVTIFSPNAEICDALATPVTIMGIQPSLHMVNQLNGVECVIIDDENKLYTSSNIHLS
ncbi:MAG: FAD:protein FMN transferase [Chitinophagia bacterium]|nr:FAD:protein FMN transferase [Chitinophagia bacterium]